MGVSMYMYSLIISLIFRHFYSDTMLMRIKKELMQI